MSPRPVREQLERARTIAKMRSPTLRRLLVRASTAELREAPSDPFPADKKSIRSVVEQFETPGPNAEHAARVFDALKQIESPEALQALLPLHVLTEIVRALEVGPEQASAEREHRRREVARLMGMPDTRPKVERHGHTMTFRLMTPEQARARIAAKRAQ